MATVVIDTPSNELSLSDYKRWFREYADAKQGEIEEAKKSRRYYHGNQLSEAVLRELKKRKQPPIRSNFIRQTIDGIVGLDTRYRQDPKAYARTPKHAMQSSVATSAIRFVCDNNDWASLSSDCIMDACQGGIMVDELNIEKDRNDQTQITQDRLEPEKFFYDPRSIKHDFSDALYMGSWGWYDISTALSLFPDKENELRESTSKDFAASEASSQEDWATNWFDTKRSLIKIIEMWVKQGEEWNFCFFTGANKLKNGTSPFLNDKGKSGCRFIPQSAYIDEQGDRYSLIRDLIPLQDEINQRRSKMLHQINTRQTWGRSGALKDVNASRTQLARPDGHIEAEGVFGQEWGIIDQNDQIAGQAQLLEASKQEIESFGPGQALLGQGGLQDSSGKALALHLQAGMAKMQPFFNRMRNWKLRNYRVIWNNVQKYWDAERYILVTDDPNDIQHIPVNTFEMDEMGNVTPQNNLAQLDVDIIIDESPDTVTLQSDAFDKIISLVQAGIQVPPEALIEASDLDEKIKQRMLKKMQDAQQADPMAQQAAQLELSGKQVAIEKTQTEVAKNLATAEKTEAETVKILNEPAY